MRKLIFAALILSFSLPSMAQYKYGLQPTGDAAYLESVKSNREKELVNLEKFIPGIVLDIRYATANNFTKEKVYDLAMAFARRPVAVALKEAQADFNRKGLGIKIYDAYRPYRATVRFYEIYHDTTYVASPYRGSRHNRGCAIDMTLVKLTDFSELPMPTEYDSFKKEAWPSSPVADPIIRKNRELIISVMEAHGFKVNASEWWHFDFVGWEKYEVLDIDFVHLIHN